MRPRIAINGFGRIGRNVMRAAREAFENEGCAIAAMAANRVQPLACISPNLRRNLRHWRR